jgi:hypothetical protein
VVLAFDESKGVAKSFTPWHGQVYFRNFEQFDNKLYVHLLKF